MKSYLAKLKVLPVVFVAIAGFLMTLVTLPYAFPSLGWLGSMWETGLGGILILLAIVLYLLGVLGIVTKAILYLHAKTKEKEEGEKWCGD